MARCNDCPACKIVLDYRIANRGKRKLIKACERNNKCVNPSQGPKKRRINEFESLHAVGHGGQIRGEHDYQLSNEVNEHIEQYGDITY